MKKVIVFIFLKLHFGMAHSQLWQKVNLKEFNALTTTHFIDAVAFNDTVLMVEQSGLFIHSDDFFSSYWIDSSHSGKTIQALSFPLRSVGYVTSSQASGGMLFSYDGGEHWQELPYSNSINSPGDVLCFIAKDTGYVSRSSLNGGLRKTTNGGIYWSDPPLLSLECPSVFRIQFLNDSVGFLLSSDNPFTPTGFGEFHLYKTANFGADWWDVNKLTYPFFPMGYADMRVLDDSTIILIADQTILRSSDGGLSFDTVMCSTDYGNDRFSQHIPAIAFCAHDTGFAAYPGSVYKTTDAGRTWHRTAFSFENGDSQNEIFFLCVASTAKVFVGCRNGNLYKTETGGGLWSDVASVEPGYAISIYPNPAVGSLQVVGLTTDMQGKAYGVDGRLIGEWPLNKSSNEIDISGLSIGVYLLVLQSGENRVVRKFVKE